MSTHAWCTNVFRDAAVRAAEDGRDGPLPTLEEAIYRAGKIVSSDGADGVKCTERDNQSEIGLRTERVTLEITHSEPSNAASWGWGNRLCPWLRPGESVRVVDTHAEEVAQSVAWEGARDAYRGRILRLTEERDAAIREREKLRARVAELEAAAKGPSTVIVNGDDMVTLSEFKRHMTALVKERDAAIRERDSWKILADRANESRDALQARVAELEAQINRDHASIMDLSRQRTALTVRVADLESQLESVACRAADAETALEAASGGGQEPVAWGFTYANGSTDGRFYNSRASAEEAVPVSGTVVPLYRWPPPPPVVDQEPKAWREHVEQMLRDWWSPKINELGDRATLEQFIGEEGLDDLLDFVLDERKGPPPPRGWLSAEERNILLPLAEAWEKRATELEQPGTWGSGLPKPQDLRADAQAIRAILSRVTDTQPRGWLTGEEKTAIEEAVEAFVGQSGGFAHDEDNAAVEKDIASLRGLLARSTPPEVDLPISLSPIDEELVRKALAAAGVKVKEVGSE